MIHNFKAGYLALIGQPNAGKSTLINALVGEKVAIVTTKPQTTRKRIVGLWSSDKGQICIVDTPGLVEAKRGLNRFLQAELEAVIKDSDALVAVLNVDEKSSASLAQVLDQVVKSKKPWCALVSKSDLGFEERVEKLKEMVRDLGGTSYVISAQDQPTAVREQIAPKLLDLLPVSPGPMYDPQMYTTQNIRELACEIVREKCFALLHQEVPFSLAVRLRDFREDKSPTTKIYADIVVAKENHRPMVIGAQGQMIKNIGQQARVEIEKLVDKKVFLDLHVVVKKQWMENPANMKELGYVNPQ